MWITIPPAIRRRVLFGLSFSFELSFRSTDVKDVFRSANSISRNVASVSWRWALFQRVGSPPGQDAGVHLERFPDHPFLFVVSNPERSKELVPGSVSLPVPKSIVSGLPGSVSFWKIPPGCPGVEDPEDPVDHRPMIPPWPPAPLVPREEWLDQLPLRIGELMASHCQLLMFAGRIERRLHSLCSRCRRLFGRGFALFLPPAIPAPSVAIPSSQCDSCPLPSPPDVVRIPDRPSPSAVSAAAIPTPWNSRFRSA